MVSRNRSMIKGESQKRTRTKRIQRSYTDEERISAVTIMLEHGGYSIEAMALIEDMLGMEQGRKISTATLAKWHNKYAADIKAAQPDLIQHNIELSTIISETRANVAKQLESILGKILTRVQDDEIFNKAQARDLAVMYGIFFDKAIKLHGLSPEVEAKVRELASVCNEWNVDMLGYLDDMINTIRASPRPPMYISATSS